MRHFLDYGPAEGSVPPILSPLDLSEAVGLPANAAEHDLRLADLLETCQGLLEGHIGQPFQATWLDRFSEWADCYELSGRPEAATLHYRATDGTTVPVNNAEVDRSGPRTVVYVPETSPAGHTPFGEPALYERTRYPIWISYQYGPMLQGGEHEVREALKVMVRDLFLLPDSGKPEATEAALERALTLLGVWNRNPLG